MERETLKFIVQQPIHGYMRSRVLLYSTVAFLFSVHVAVAVPPRMKKTSFEADIALEREQFPWAKTVLKGAQVADDTNDLVFFDKKSERKATALQADLKRMQVQAGAGGWEVEFETVAAIPEDPGMPVNFDVFFDRDGDPSNNAPDGVFRAGSDAVFMILFGTRTKWHATSWSYVPAEKRWREGAAPVYKVSPTKFSLTIPYELVPKNENILVRGFSLVLENGITAVDIVPGAGLPVVRK